MIMAAPQGNRFWEARSKHGRNPIFASPEQLWEACCEYFEWVEENPLYESKPFAYQGVVVQEPVAKMRAMTISHLCIFLGISMPCWLDYKKKDDFSNIVNNVEEIIRTQKMQGAAADLLNANIIARDLGLVDKAHVENKHAFENVSDLELESRIQALENELKGKAD